MDWKDFFEDFHLTYRVKKTKTIKITTRTKKKRKKKRTLIP